jgi:hypothetical protein
LGASADRSARSFPWCRLAIPKLGHHRATPQKMQQNPPTPLTKADTS